MLEETVDRVKNEQLRRFDRQLQVHEHLSLRAVGVRANQVRGEADGQVGRRHHVGVRVLLDPVQKQEEKDQALLVDVRELKRRKRGDEGAGVLLHGLDHVVVQGERHNRFRQVPDERFQQRRDVRVRAPFGGEINGLTSVDFLLQVLDGLGGKGRAAAGCGVGGEG